MVACDLNGNAKGPAPLNEWPSPYRAPVGLLSPLAGAHYPREGRFTSPLRGTPIVSAKVGNESRNTRQAEPVGNTKTNGGKVIRRNHFRQINAFPGRISASDSIEPTQGDGLDTVSFDPEQRHRRQQRGLIHLMVPKANWVGRSR